MIKTVELIVQFEVEVNPKNIHLVKQLAACDVIDERPEDIEIGDEISVDYSLEGEFTDYAIMMAMLFNLGTKGQPKMTVVRDERTLKDETHKYPFTSF